MKKHVIVGPVVESHAAARGIEVHQVLAAYINHLLRTKRSKDFEVFDGLLSCAGIKAREALEKFRDNHAFDPESVLATELYIALDEGFRPLDGEERTEGSRARRRPHPAYEGTLDLVMVESITEAEIHDWKSYFQVIAADTFQSKFYPLLLMCLNPSIERVTFVLEFIRYGASRSVEYTRRDLPWLKELAEQERTRQRRLHANGRRTPAQLKASPGRHCTWCPLLLNGCPVAEANPYGQMSAEERLRFALWLQEAEKQNAKILRDMMVEQGPILYRDENQEEYTADFVPIPKKFYPYHKVLPVLNEWLQAHPEDREFTEKLTVSGLSSPLKAGKRAGLAQRLTELAEVRVDTELRIGRSRKDGAGAKNGNLDDSRHRATIAATREA